MYVNLNYHKKDSLFFFAEYKNEWKQHKVQQQKIKKK